MDREVLAKKLNIESLEDYIINEFISGKNEAEFIIQSYFEDSISEIEKIENEEVKFFKILSELLKIKNEFSSLKDNHFSYMIEESKFYLGVIPINEVDRFSNLANYILDYYDFKKSTNIFIETSLLKLRENSRNHHLIFNYISKSSFYFDLLKIKYKTDGFTWNWRTFENGLMKVLMNNSGKIIDIKGKCTLEVERIEINKKHEIEDILYEKKEIINSLKYEIDDLTREVTSLNSKIDYQKEYFDKYYYDSQIIVSNTYIGDNLPFLFNLFNFLKANNLFSYGWSYFYSCMLIGNSEMIPLKSSKKQNFIGRIFFHFIQYLILHYKDESFKFLQSKFLINESILSENFKTNHMKANYDIELESELVFIDDFFTKQKKIYLKL